MEGGAGNDGNIPALDFLFHPRSVAVAGVSQDAFNPGQILFIPLLSSGFQGDIYPIHPKGGTNSGLKCYTSLREVPGPVDLVISAIPSRFTPQLVKDCVAKGVKACSFFTAGFSETGEDDAIELEAELLQIARTGDVRLVGPNCMGIYCPSSGVTFGIDFPKEAGHLGLLCQSGGNTIYLIRAGAMRGIHMSKAISYGNACDVNECDLLEYFTQDPETQIIAAYIEGVKDEGKRFISAMREAASTKPLIVLKGGQTESGASTVASHTGALAGSIAVWDSLIEQVGAIPVSNLDEIVDVASILTYMPALKGRRVAIIGIGGGASVLAADDCAKANLLVPRLPGEVMGRLKQLTTAAGNMFGNPVDTQAFMIGSDEFAETIKIVGAWDGIDILLLHLAHDLMGASIDAMIDLGLTRYMTQVMVDAAKEVGKPAAVVLHFTTLTRSYQAVCEARELCWKSGVPVFFSISAAANAIDKSLQYYQRKDGIFA
ncbi:MAG: CoA-binding protein [Chloroflexota bacterium]|nr:CoA-binding protein [Chloroflexota bacterium]